jgi:hypothetical protein
VSDTLKKLSLTNYNYLILFYLSLSIPYKQIEVFDVCISHSLISSELSVIIWYIYGLDVGIEFLCIYDFFFFL